MEYLREGAPLTPVPVLERATDWGGEGGKVEELFIAFGAGTGRYRGGLDIS